MPEPAVSESVKDAVRAFMRLAAVVETISGELWQSHQLTLTQARCLRLLQDRPLVAGALAQKLGLSAASLTRVLERLEARALLERTVDQQDRRRITVSLTGLGRETLGGIQFWMASPVVDAIAGMSEARRSQFTAVLEELLRDVGQGEAQSRGGSPPPGEGGGTASGVEARGIKAR